MAYKKSQIPSFAPLLQKASEAANEALVEGMDEYAEGVRSDFVTRIEEQRFAAFRARLYPEGDPENLNLSPQWVGRKRAKGADLRTMIATRNYVDSIGVHRRLNARRRGGLWRVGFHPRKRARDLDGNIVGILLDDVAKIHEHGNTATPRRPHWGPNLRRLQRESPATGLSLARKVGKAVVKATHGKVAVTVGGEHV